MSSIPVLGYWNISAYAEPIRLLLTYLGKEFKDKRYDYGPAPDFSREEWLRDKFSLGLELPNIPYYIDGDVKITQTNAILRYLAYNNDLLGLTPRERLRCDMAMEQALDDQVALYRVCYSSNYDMDKEKYVKTLPDHYTMLEKFLGANAWIAGEHLTVADFRMYESLAEHRMWPPAVDVFTRLPSSMAAYMGRFEALPKIKEYMQTDKFKSTLPLGRGGEIRF